jgi:hypothetical protein
MAQLHHQRRNPASLERQVRAVRRLTLKEPAVALVIIAVIFAINDLWRSQLWAANVNAQGASQADHGGLKVEFTYQCSKGTVQLRGSITNGSPEPITIRIGSLPWQYDVLGSEFSAEANGKKLKRNWTAPILGRVGPITLVPNEHRSGVVPIGTLFPDLSTTLRIADVVVHWRYLTTGKPVAGDASTFQGHLVIRRNACNS